MDDDIAQECLEKLQDICADRGTLPPSYILSGEPIKTSPLANGPDLTLWNGIYRGKGVYIVSWENNYENRRKVCIQYRVSSPHLLMGILGYRR